MLLTWTRVCQASSCSALMQCSMCKKKRQPKGGMWPSTMPASRQKVSTFTSFWNTRALVSSLPTGPAQHSQRCTVLYCTVLYCTVLYCTVLCCAVLYCAALHRTALHCTALHRTALYRTALHCTATSYKMLRYNLVINNHIGRQNMNICQSAYYSFNICLSLAASQHIRGRRQGATSDTGRFNHQWPGPHASRD